MKNRLVKIFKNGEEITDDRIYWLYSMPLKEILDAGYEVINEKNEYIY